MKFNYRLDQVMQIILVGEFLSHSPVFLVVAKLIAGQFDNLKFDILSSF